MCLKRDLKRLVTIGGLSSRYIPIAVASQAGTEMYESNFLCCILQRGKGVSNISTTGINCHFISNFNWKIQLLMFTNKSKASFPKGAFWIAELRQIEILAPIFTSNFSNNFLKYLSREHMQNALHMFYIFS